MWETEGGPTGVAKRPSFAIAYEDLALDQLEAHGAEIRAELEEIFSGEYYAELLWATDEHLSNVAFELGMLRGSR